MWFSLRNLYCNVILCSCHLILDAKEIYILQLLCPSQYNYLSFFDFLVWYHQFVIYLRILLNIPFVCFSLTHLWRLHTENAHDYWTANVLLTSMRQQFNAIKVDKNRGQHTVLTKECFQTISQVMNNRLPISVVT